MKERVDVAAAVENLVNQYHFIAANRVQDYVIARDEAAQTGR